MWGCGTEQARGRSTNTISKVVMLIIKWGSLTLDTYFFLTYRNKHFRRHTALKYYVTYDLLNFIGYHDVGNSHKTTPKRLR